MKLRRLICSAIVVTASLTLSSHANAQINFNFLGSTGNAQADAGFQLAADFIASEFDDNLTVNINRGFANLGGSTLAQAGSTAALYSFADFRNAIVADSISADDATFAANLPGGASFSVYINETDEATGGTFDNPYVDNDGGANNTQVRLNHANAKAIGLRAANDGDQDVQITFNSAFAFDFDPSDGISAGQIDFVGVTIHEIMHSLGFTSGVDVLANNSGGFFNDDQFTFVNSLDFARFSADQIAAGADIDWTADNREKFFSFDAGATPGSNLGGGTNHFSRGAISDDGSQASHWRDNLGLGIMDPTANPAGSLNFVSELDLRALDIIGWNRVVVNVPEPGTALILTSMLCGFGLVRRRKS